jgi:hypothetical protein
MIKTEVLQYDIRHDLKEKNARFLSKQLETHLKERFNVLISTVEYGIENGHLVREGTKEPFIESIRRGRDFIQKISLDNIDKKREDAEVVGFEKIDSFLSNPLTPVESKILSISPKGEKGSKYQHNFYDIFTLKEKNNKRYVELSRFSSGLTVNDYINRLGKNFKNPPQANPIELPSSLSPREIHSFLHVKHEYMEPSEFERIWQSPLVQFFVDRYQLDRSARSFNAILNAADEVWKNKDREDDRKYEYLAKNTISYEYIKILEEKEVRQAGGQCPGKSGADINNSPFSVSAFGLGENFGYDFDQDGPCRKCNAINVKCGPCGICKNCDLEIRASQKFSLN